MSDNIFRRAKELLDKKHDDKLTQEERQLINTAIIPLMVRTNGIFSEDITISQGLEELAKIVEREMVDKKPLKGSNPM